LRDGVLRTDQALSARIKGRVDVIHRDRQGDLWFGSQTGLYRLDSAGQITHYTPAQGLTCTHVKTLLEDASGRLWIGGYEGVSLWQNGAETDGLLSDRVIALYEDRERTVWVGTYDGGLYRLREEAAGWKLTRYTTREGLFSNEVKQILEDDQGFFWTGSSRGIYRLRKQELNDFADGRIAAVTATHFGRADGLANLDISSGFQPSGFRAREGRLWFPTQDGIAVLDPRRIPFNPTPPPVVIEDCLLDRQNAPCRQGLTMKPGQAALEISYTALSFHKSEQLRFRYRMDGLEETWNEVGTRRTAYYSHLPPGSYTFRVIAANSDGVWNSEGQSLRVTVLPPFYRTWWFLTLSALIVISSVFAAYKYRITQLERRQAAQESFSRQLIEFQEQERKRIAAGLHDSLGQQLLVIKNWAMIGIANGESQTHEPLAEISTTASQAIDEVRQVVYDLRPYQLDKIGLANTLRFMIEKVGAAAGLEIQTEFGAIDNLFSHNEQVTLYRIVQECVNNIARHAQATTARVVITPHGETVRVLIEDNGRGFVVTQRQGGGFGLQGLHERVRILKGEITIDSAPGNGTKIQITIERKPKQ
jgi:signal transduction histidine kinase